MAINPNLFIHESDRVALTTLKAIPGFTQLLKAYMKVLSEQQLRIQNMASNLRINKNQLPKYYNMLLPICEKLGIEVPELYLELNVQPNAYTSGDTKPFIVITSGLLETLPEELIPTVLAHECGHIACHHVLYSTMGRMILDSATSLLGLNDLVSFPLQAAFYYWMRCSELSADRVAAVCDGSADKTVEVCMRLAGYDKDIKEPANIEAFLGQAVEYKKMMTDSKWNKTLEFLMFNQKTHPLTAVRAYEVNEWTKKDCFNNVVTYINASNGIIPKESIKSLPINEPTKALIGKPYYEVQQQLLDTGFVNIVLERITEKQKLVKEDSVISVLNANDEVLKQGDWYSVLDTIKIIYYEPWTEEEIIAMHPGETKIPDAAKKLLGRNYEQVVQELTDVGFVNIQTLEIHQVKKGIFEKDGNVSRIIVDKQVDFNKGDWFAIDVPIFIEYNTYDTKEN